MNEEDLRDCAALLRAVTGATAEECFAFADEFIEARKKEKGDEGSGIAAVAPKRSRKR